MRKRWIALLLSLMMVLVLLPASFAEEDPAAEEIPEQTESLEPAEGLRAAGDVSIDNTNFPDDNFRNYVQYDLPHADPSYFTPAEIADITVIECGDRNIENLQGIELFTSLEALNCQDNQLMDIDVSAMPSLKKLDCHSNPLSGTIQIHENLEELECWNSQIDGTRILIPMNSRLRVVKVDASGFSDLSFLYGLDLETLDCAYIDFESLDFTPWNNLHELRCDNCNLSRLNVSGLLNLTRIRANDNNLTALDVSTVPALEELYVNNNHIAALDLSACSQLWGAELDQTVSGLLTEDSGHYLFDLTAIGVADAGKVSISDTDWTLNTGTGVATYNGSGIPNELVYTYDTGNASFPMQVTVTLGVAVTVDPNDFDPDFFDWLLNEGVVMDDGNGVYTISSGVTELDCGYRGLTSLKGIEYFQNLERLNCQDNELNDIDVSAMDSLKRLDCHSNPLSGTIQIHENLEELECWNSQIDGSRILYPSSSSLRVLKVDASNVSDLSFFFGLPLETLDCPYNSFGTLDFTVWPTLHDLCCDSCNLTSLTVSGLTNLTRIRANDNDLTELDVSTVPALEELYVNNNHIAALDLSACSQLWGAELDQTASGMLTEDSGHYLFDLTAIGVADAGKVTISDTNWTLNTGTGVATYNGSGIPNELVYTYDTGNASFPMQVTVTLGVAVTVDRNDFDPDFFDWLLNEGVVNDDGNGGYTISSGVTELDCGYQGLTSLKGIEYFQNLERLNCQDNNLTNALSAELSQNTALKTLICHSNHDITALDFSANPNLEELEVLNCSGLMSLNIANNANLRKLVVDATPLPLQDSNGNWIYENNTAVTELSVAYKDLKELDVSMLPNIENLHFTGNKLVSLDLSMLDSLNWVMADDLQLAELKLSPNAPLSDVTLEQHDLEGYEVTPAGSGFTFDLSAFVKDLSCVSNLQSDATFSFDVNSGMITFDACPDWFSYTYDTGVGDWDVKFVDVKTAPTLMRKTLVLSGLIGVNFYMDLSGLDDDEKANSYMEFTINGRTERADFDPDFTSPSRGIYYGFTCHIASIEMADEIAAAFHYREDKAIETSYTAQEYIEQALQSQDYPEEAKALVKATADYGHYVQAFLKEIKNWPDDEHVTIDAASTIDEEAIAAATEGTADHTVIADAPEGAFIRSLGYSIIMDDMVTIVLNIRTETGHTLNSAKIGDDELPIESTANGRYRVRIENVMAHQLGDRYHVTLNAGGEDASITVSVLSYANILLTAPVYADNMTAKQAGAAIYQYYMAAIGYIADKKAK